MTLTLKIANNFFFLSAWHSGSWCYITIPSLVTKCSAVQKISTGQTFTDILNFCCDLNLEHSNQIFPRALWLTMVYYQTKFGSKWTSSLDDRVEIVIFWLYKPSLWTWPWRKQQQKISAWHSGSWCCIATPNLILKCSVIQKITSGHTYTDILNLRCDLDLEHSNPIFTQHTQVYDAVLSKPSLIANRRAA